MSELELNTGVLSQRHIHRHGVGHYIVTVYADHIEVDDDGWDSVFTLPGDPGDAIILTVIGLVNKMFNRGVESGKNIKMDEIRRALNVPAIPLEVAY